jgi:hypothetical protein
VVLVLGLDLYFAHLKVSALVEIVLAVLFVAVVCLVVQGQYPSFPWHAAPTQRPHSVLLSLEILPSKRYLCNVKIY